MDSDKIRKIIKHASKLLQEVISEIFGDTGKEGSVHDETTNPGQTGDDTPKHNKDVA